MSALRGCDCVHADHDRPSYAGQRRHGHAGRHSFLDTETHGALGDLPGSRKIQKEERQKEMSYVYRAIYRTETQETVFDVGFYDPAGHWYCESSHPYREDAGAQVSYLNGGIEPGALAKLLEQR